MERQFKEIQLPVPWGHVAAKVYGSPTDPRVLMVHGILDNAGSFDRLMTHLPAEYQYVCIDLPGHGFSSPFPAGLPLDFFNYVYTIKLVLDGLEWKNCIYIGHSLGAQLGIYFSILCPGRLEKIIALEGIMPIPIKNDDLCSRFQEIYDLDAYSKNLGLVYKEDEVLHALQFKRLSTLNSEAAKALFKRAVTKVGDLYQYNRDPRLRMYVKPPMNVSQHVVYLQNLTTPILILTADGSNRIYKVRELVKVVESRINEKRRFRTISVSGNHDVHNNNPERVAPHIREYLSNDVKSKL